MSADQVFWQPDTGKLPVLVGELLPENGGEVAGSRRVRRWGRVEQVEEHLLRGPGAVGLRVKDALEKLAAYLPGVYGRRDDWVLRA